MKCSVFEQSHGDVKLIKPFIKGKVVYDIGSGDGAFAKEMAEFAKEVVAVEIEPIYALACRDLGLKTIEADFVKIKPECEVIYAFLSFVGNYQLTRWIREHSWHGTVISQFYPLGVDPTEPMKPNGIIHSDLPFLIYKI